MQASKVIEGCMLLSYDPYCPKVDGSVPYSGSEPIVSISDWLGARSLIEGSRLFQHGCIRVRLTDAAMQSY